MAHRSLWRKHRTLPVRSGVLTAVAHVAHRRLCVHIVHDANRRKASEQRVRVKGCVSCFPNMASEREEASAAMLRTDANSSTTVVSMPSSTKDGQTSAVGSTLSAELRTNLLKSSKFKAQAMTDSSSPSKKHASPKQSVGSPLVTAKTTTPVKQEPADHSSAVDNKCNGNPNVPCKANAIVNGNGHLDSETEQSTSLTSPSKPLSSKASNDKRTPSTSPGKCSRCRKKQMCNVRIQCKMEQYLSSRLNHMKRELSLSMRIPRPPLPAHELSHLRFGKFYRVEEHANGGAKLLRLYWDEIAHLAPQERLELAQEFLREGFREEPVGAAK